LQTQGPSNLRWNLRTLNLMATAGLLELCGLSATDPRRVGEAELEGVFDYELRFAALRRLRPDHKDRASFDRQMNLAREAYERTGREAFDALRAIADGQVPVEDGLASLYQLGGRLRWSPVDRLCGGCASHWSSRPRSALTPRPLVGRLRRFRAADALAWPAALPRVEPSFSLVRVEDVATALSHGPLLPAILGRLRPHTVLLPYDAPPSVVEAVRTVVLRQGSDVFIDRFDPDDPTTADAGEGEIRLVLWTSATISAEMLTSLRTSPGSLCAMLVDRRVPDPVRPDRPLTDVLDCADETEVLRAVTT
jgi:ATP-dependent DNA helicase RecQ